MVQPRRLVVIALVFLGCVVLDQVTKKIAIHHRTTIMANREKLAFPSSWYPKDLFRFQYAENTGAFLSLGSRLSESARFWVLTALNSVILMLVLLVLLFRPLANTAAVLALTLILSGGVGNLIDRVFRGGKVVDFMNMGIGSLRTGIFNVADLAIVGGLVFLLIIEFFKPKGASDEKHTGAEEA